MPDYTLDITHDWKRTEDGSAHRQFSARVDWLGAGEWRCAWPSDHPGARDMLTACAPVTAGGGGEKPRRWGVALRSQVGGDSFGFFARRVGLIDGAVDGYEANSIVAEGYADDAVLVGALGYPDPSQDSTTGTVGGWSVYADGPWANAEDALLDVIRDNLGSTALTRRKLAALTLPASLGRGPAVNLRRRFPTLLDWARAVCLASGLSLRVVRTATGLTVEVSQVQQKPDAVWSRQTGSAAGVGVFFEDSPDSVLVGGKRTTETDETSRKMLRVNATATVPGFPWEVFKDDTSADTLAELAESGAERLAEESGEASAVVGFRADGPRLGVDFNLGDLVPVNAGRGPSGVSAKSRVESVEIEHARSGSWLLRPLPGQPVGDPLAVQRRLFSDVRRRLTS